MPGSWNNIWVISDTHLRFGKHLPDSFVSRVSREDLILHLGDYISIDVVESLERIASFEGVSGNCDPPEIKTIFPPRKILAIDGWRIGMIHGSGSASSTIGRARREFSNKADIVLYGHTHAPHCLVSDGTLYFNPGSVSQGRGNNTGFGLLKLDGTPAAEFFKL